MGDGTVESRIVQVARTYRDLAVVTGGVTEGETVVTEGQLRLRKGERVEILNKP
jgi:multidrug efflux pump subunit AcrA (membrane-fusion protein)